MRSLGRLRHETSPRQGSALFSFCDYAGALLLLWISVALVTNPLLVQHDSGIASPEVLDQTNFVGARLKGGSG